MTGAQTNRQTVQQHVNGTCAKFDLDVHVLSVHPSINCDRWTIPNAEDVPTKRPRSRATQMYDPSPTPHVAVGNIPVGPALQISELEMRVAVESTLSSSLFCFERVGSVEVVSRPKDKCLLSKETAIQTEVLLTDTEQMVLSHNSSFDHWRTSDISNRHREDSSEEHTGAA